jgi:hypothetical protein
VGGFNAAEAKAALKRGMISFLACARIIPFLQIACPHSACKNLLTESVCCQPRKQKQIFEALNVI